MFIVNNAPSPFYLGYAISGFSGFQMAAGVLPPMTRSGVPVSGGMYVSLAWVASGGSPPAYGTQPMMELSGNASTILTASIDLITSGIIPSGGTVLPR